MRRGSPGRGRRFLLRRGQALPRHHRPRALLPSGKEPVECLCYLGRRPGIWGAVALGVVGAWIGCRRAKVSLVAFLDAVAPGVVFAQALGRWGNWFNNELYGDPTALPWKLQIHQMDAATGSAVTDPSGAPVVLGYFQPTFLYESLWCDALRLCQLGSGAPGEHLGCRADLEDRVVRDVGVGPPFCLVDAAVPDHPVRCGVGGIGAPHRTRAGCRIIGGGGDV